MVSQTEGQAWRDRIETISLEIMIALVFEHQHHPLRLIGIKLSRGQEVRAETDIRSPSQQAAIQPIPAKRFLDIPFIPVHRHTLPTQRSVVAKRSTAVIPHILLRQGKSVVPEYFPDISLPIHDLRLIHQIIRFLHISHIIQVETG